MCCPLLVGVQHCFLSIGLVSVPQSQRHDKGRGRTFHKVHPKPLKALCVEDNWVPPGEVDHTTSAEEMAHAHAKVSCYREAPGSGLAHKGTTWWRGVERLELCSGCVCSPDVSSCRPLCNQPGKFVLWANRLGVRRAAIGSSPGQYWNCREATTRKLELRRR